MDTNKIHPAQKLQDNVNTAELLERVPQLPQQQTRQYSPALSKSIKPGLQLIEKDFLEPQDDAMGRQMLYHTPVNMNDIELDSFQGTIIDDFDDSGELPAWMSNESLITAARRYEQESAVRPGTVVYFQNSNHNKSRLFFVKQVHANEKKVDLVRCLSEATQSDLDAGYERYENYAFGGDIVCRLDLHLDRPDEMLQSSTQAFLSTLKAARAKATQHTECSGFVLDEQTLQVEFHGYLEGGRLLPLVKQSGKILLAKRKVHWDEAPCKMARMVNAEALRLDANSCMQSVMQLVRQLDRIGAGFRDSTRDLDKTGDGILNLKSDNEMKAFRDLFLAFGFINSSEERLNALIQYFNNMPMANFALWLSRQLLSFGQETRARMLSKAEAALDNHVKYKEKPINRYKVNSQWAKSFKRKPGEKTSKFIARAQKEALDRQSDGVRGFGIKGKGDNEEIEFYWAGSFPLCNQNRNSEAKKWTSYVLRSGFRSTCIQREAQYRNVDRASVEVYTPFCRETHPRVLARLNNQSPWEVVELLSFRRSARYGFVYQCKAPEPDTAECKTEGPIECDSESKSDDETNKGDDAATASKPPASWSEIKPENIQAMPRGSHLKGDVVEAWYNNTWQVATIINQSTMHNKCEVAIKGSNRLLQMDEIHIRPRFEVGDTVNIVPEHKELWFHHLRGTVREVKETGYHVEVEDGFSDHTIDAKPSKIMAFPEAGNVYAFNLPGRAGFLTLVQVLSVNNPSSKHTKRSITGYVVSPNLPQHEHVTVEISLEPEADGAVGCYLCPKHMLRGMRPTKRILDRAVKEKEKQRVINYLAKEDQKYSGNYAVVLKNGPPTQRLPNTLALPRKAKPMARYVVRHACFHPSQDYVVSTSDDGMCFVWSTVKHEVVVQLEVTESCAQNSRANILERSRAWVTSCGFSRDGTRLAACGNGVLKIWNWDQISELKRAKKTDVLIVNDETDVSVVDFSEQVRSQGLFVLDIAFSATNPNEMATTDSGCSIRIWDIAKQKELYCLKKHKKMVHCVAGSPDGSAYVTGSEDSTAIIWRWSKDKSNFQLCKRLQHGHKTNETNVGINDIMFSPDGQMIATCGQDGNAVLWCAFHGWQLARLVGGHTQSINSIAFSSCSNFVCTAGEDMKCAVWDRFSGNLVGYLDNMHSAAVNCVRFSNKEFKSSGNPFILLTASDDNSIILFNLAASRAVRLRDGTLTGLSSLQGSEFSSKSEVRFLKTEEELAKMVSRQRSLASELFHDGSVLRAATCVAACATRPGLALVGLEDGSIVFWDTNMNKKLACVEGGELLCGMLVKEKVHGRSRTPTCCGRPYRLSSMFPGAYTAGFNCDSCGASADGTDCRFVCMHCQVDICLKCARGHAHTKAVTAAAFHPSLPLVVTVSEDKFGILWNINTGLKQWQARDSTSKGIRVLRRPDKGYLVGHEGKINAVAFSPDGRYIASSSPQEMCVMIWNAMTGRHITSLSGGLGVAFTPDSRSLVTGHVTNGLTLHNWFTGLSTRVAHPVHQSPISSICINNLGTKLISTAMDGSCVRWTLDGDSITKPKPVDMSPVHGEGHQHHRLEDGDAVQFSTMCCFDYNGKYAAVTSATGSAMVFDADTGRVKFVATSKELVRSFGSKIANEERKTDFEVFADAFVSHTSPVTGCCFPGDEVLLTCSEDGSCIKWHYSAEPLVPFAKYALMTSKTWYKVFEPRSSYLPSLVFGGSGANLITEIIREDFQRDHRDLVDWLLGREPGNGMRCVNAKVVLDALKSNPQYLSLLVDNWKQCGRRAYNDWQASLQFLNGGNSILQALPALVKEDIGEDSLAKSILKWWSSKYSLVPTPYALYYPCKSRDTSYANRVKFFAREEDQYPSPSAIGMSTASTPFGADVLIIDPPDSKTIPRVDEDSGTTRLFVYTREGPGMVPVFPCTLSLTYENEETNKLQHGLLHLVTHNFSNIKNVFSAPGIELLCNYKWNEYARMQFYGKVAWFFAYLVCFLIFTMILVVERELLPKVDSLEMAELGETNFFGGLKFPVEINATGSAPVPLYLETHTPVTLARLYEENNSTYERFLLILMWTCGGLCAVFAVFSLLARFVCSISKAGLSYWRNYWHTLDIVFSIVVLTMLIMYVTRVPHTASVAAVGTTLAIFKIPQFMRGFFALGGLWNSIKSVAIAMFYFFLFVFLMTWLFAHAFFVLFAGFQAESHPLQHKFGHYITSIMTAFLYMHGEIELEGFDDSYYRLLGYIGIIVFTIFIVLILFNLLIALITEAYEGSKDERANSRVKERAAIIVNIENQVSMICCKRNFGQTHNPNPSLLCCKRRVASRAPRYLHVLMPARALQSKLVGEYRLKM